jgi:hypothetical protein
MENIPVSNGMILLTGIGKDNDFSYTTLPRPLPKYWARRRGGEENIVNANCQFG